MDPVLSGMDPTTPLEVFNNLTDANGGDSRLYNLNVFYNVSSPQISTSKFVSLMSRSPATSLGCSRQLPSCFS